MSRAHVALKLRLAPEAKAKLEALAAYKGLTVSAYVEAALARVSMPTITPARTRMRLAEARARAQGSRA